MTSREIDGGLFVTESRLTGITVDEVLRSRVPDLFKPHGHLWWKKPEPSLATSSLRFEGIAFCEISGDKKHVLAVAKDEDRQFLVRDEKILLAGNFSSLSVEVATPEFSHLVVISENRQGRKSLESFDSNNPDVDFYQKTLIEGADDLALVDYDMPWPGGLSIASTIGERTGLSIWDEKRNLLGDFTVPLVLDLNSVKLVAHKDDCSVVIWTGKLDGRECVFKNEELLASKASYYDVCFNADLSRVLLMSEDEDEAEIILNGERLLQSQAIIKDCGVDMETGYAVASLIDGGEWRLFYLTPQTHGILDEHFDNILRVRVYGGLIEAVVVRNVVKRKITISDRQ